MRLLSFHLSELHLTDHRNYALDRRQGSAERRGTGRGYFGSLSRCMLKQTQTSSTASRRAFAARWMGDEREVLLPIRVTRQARWPKRLQSAEMRGYVANGGWFSQACYVDRNRVAHLSCKFI